MKLIKDALKIVFSKKNLLVFACFLSSLSMMFCSGIFSPNTKIEQISSYIADTVETKVPTKDLLCVTVQSNSGLSLPDSENQFLSLYGVFRQERMTFASGYNFHKNQTIIVDELDPTLNLSVVYIGSTTGSDIIDDDTRGVIYKDVTYPVYFLFPLERNNAISPQTACFGTRQARQILKNRGIVKEDDQYTKSDYQTLLNTGTNITIEGQTKYFLIQDIFFDDTYYINGLNNTIGDFFITSYYFPFPETVKKANAYFMSAFEYENEFFINYLNEVYGPVGYDMKPVETKLTDSIDSEYVVSFNNLDTSLRFLEALLITFGTFIALLGVILIFHFYDSYPKTMLFSDIAVLFVPYLCFYLAHVIFNTIAIFSSTGTVANAIACIVISVLLIALYFYKKYYKVRAQIKKEQKERYEELGI